MKTFGLKQTKEIVSLPINIDGSPNFRAIIPFGQYLEGDSFAPWNLKPDDFIGVDYSNFIFTPPEVIPLVKLPKPEYDDNLQNCKSIIVWFEDRIERGWQIIDKTNEEKLMVFSNICFGISQKRLDSLAQSWEYDNISSLVSYAGDPHPRFNAEGIVGKQFRSDEWTAADNFRTACLNGNIYPSIENYLSFLPPIPTRPII